MTDFGLKHCVEESLCASGVHGCTGAECTGDAGEYCDEEFDPKSDVLAVLVGVVACDGAHGLPPSFSSGQ